MRKIFLLLFTTIAFNAMSNEPVAIPNVDMSQWNFVSGSTTEYEHLPVGYRYSGSNATATSIDYFSKAAESYNGKPVMKMTYGGSSGSCAYFTTPSFSLSPGDYQLKFYVKGKGYLRSINLCTVDVPKANRSTSSDANLTTGGTTYIMRPMGTSANAQTIADWTEKTQNVTVTAAGCYELNICHNNQVNGNEFYISGISFTKTSQSELNADCSLQRILLSAANYTRGIPESLPGFDPETLNYTVDLSFNYIGDVPAVSPFQSQYETVEFIETATSLSGSNNVTSIKVTSSDGTVSKTYNITFKQTKDFISGCFTDFKTKPYADFGYVDGSAVYCNEKEANHGLYWGDNATRPNSNGTYELMTPPLVNGMGTISFYVKDYVNLSTQDIDASALLVQYRMKSSDPWTRIDSIPATEITDDMGWVYKSYIMNKELVADIDTPQVRFYIYREVNTRDFAMDDFRVTAYSSSSLGDNKISGEDNLKIYSGKQSISIEQPGNGSYQIYALTGQLISSGNFTDKISVPVQYRGLYIVKVSRITKKIIVN